MTVDGSSMNETRTKAAGPARSHPQLRALSHASHERQQRERELERRAMLRKLRSAAATVTLEEEEHAAGRLFSSLIVGTSLHSSS